MDHWSESTARAAFIIACALVALTGLWFNTQPYACPVPIALTGKVENPVPCFEFWLNRYQTILGVFVAIVAGLVTWSAGQRQTTVANQQRALDLIPIVTERMESVRMLFWATDNIARANIRIYSTIRVIDELIAEFSLAKDDRAKQGEFREDFTRKTKLYLENVETLQKRVSYIRENTRHGLLLTETKRIIEDYMECVSVINDQHGKLARRIEDAIAAVDWVTFKMKFKNLESTARTLPITVDLQKHPVHVELRRTIVVFERTLDHVLNESHKT